jgi:hypothetical protein
MSPALKELAKKTYLVIKHRVLPKEYQVKGGAFVRGSQTATSQEYFENRGIVLRTGDVIKFGRVPFRIKENSLQMVEGQDWQDSMMMGLDGFHGPQMQSMEKNITDIDSADLEREMRVDIEEGQDRIDMSILNESQKMAL